MVLMDFLSMGPGFIGSCSRESVFIRFSAGQGNHLWVFDTLLAL